MAHARQDTLAAPMEWAKHLKKRGKRAQARRERKASQKAIRVEVFGTSWTTPS